MIVVVVAAAAAAKAIVRNGTIVVYASVGVIVSIGYCGGRGSRTDSIRISLNEHTIACYFNCCHHFIIYIYICSFRSFVCFQLAAACVDSYSY